MTRILVYGPHHNPPELAIGDLRRLQTLTIRVAERLFHGQAGLPFLIKQTIPRLINAKLEAGVPTITKNQLVILQRSEVGATPPPTLDEYKDLLEDERFPFDLDYPPMHQELIHDYTKIKPEDDRNKRPSIRLAATPEGVAIYYAAMNPPN